MLAAVKKLGAFVLLVALAVLIAGVYGALHNQISYTVSPEYFTKFKFEQFGLLDLRLPDRIRASIVGFLASWWMGIPIGILVSVAGFIHPGYRRMIRVSLWSFLVVMAVTLLVGLWGLVNAYVETASVNVGNSHPWYAPGDVIDRRRFYCAGSMHDSSYLGGVLGMFVAWIFHIVVRLRTWSRSRSQRRAALAATEPPGR